MARRGSARADVAFEGSKSNNLYNTSETSDE